MNCKIIKICNIFICCEVNFKIQTADSGKAPFYNCTENVKIKMINIIFTLFIFIVKKAENKLILKYSWKQAVEINIFN